MHIRTNAWALLAISSLAMLGDSVTPSTWLRQLRFSPDGRDILAQADAEITILSVEPFAIRFRISAPNSSLAQFTPDSKEVVFLSPIPSADRNKIGLEDSPAHVERWSLADGTRSAVATVPLQDCETVALSPTGEALTCITFEGTLRLIDVRSGTRVFEKIHFAQDPEFFDAYNPFPFGFYPSDKGAAYLDYSTDGRFLMAAPSDSTGRSLGFDLFENEVLALKGGLNRLHSDKVPYFKFVAPNIILLSGRHGLRDTLLTTLVDFPSGRIDSKLALPPGPRPFSAPWPISRLTDPDFISIQPFGSPTFCAYNFRTKEAITSEHPAIDVLGSSYVVEPSAGVVGLYRRGKGLQASIALHPPAGTK